MNKMKNFKRIFAVFMAAVMLFSFASCKDNTDNGEINQEETTSYIRENKTRIAVLNGVDVLGTAKLRVSRDYAYAVTNCNSAEEIMNMVTEGKADLAALPLDLAAKLYNSTNGGVKILAVNTLGVLHILTGDSDVTSFADIKGKTVYATGKGSYYEYFIRYILTQNGIDPEKDVKIEYKEQDELTTLALDGTAKLCFIPEPYATKVITENKEMKRLVDLNALWEKSAGTKPVQGVVIARTEYIEQNPEYIETFLFQNEVSVNFANEKDGLGINFLAANNFFSSHELAKASVPLCKLTFMKGEDMKPVINSTFDVFYGIDPASVGGTIPADGIFY